MQQYTLQELKWIEQSLRRDIDALTVFAEESDAPGLIELAKLDICNKTALRDKTDKMMERVRARATRQR